MKRELPLWWWYDTPPPHERMRGRYATPRFRHWCRHGCQEEEKELLAALRHWYTPLYMFFIFTIFSLYSTIRCFLLWYMIYIYILYMIYMICRFFCERYYIFLLSFSIFFAFAFTLFSYYYYYAIFAAASSIRYYIYARARHCRLHTIFIATFSRHYIIIISFAFSFIFFSRYFSSKIWLARCASFAVRFLIRAFTARCAYSQYFIFLILLYTKDIWYMKSDKMLLPFSRYMPPLFLRYTPRAPPSRYIIRRSLSPRYYAMPLYYTYAAPPPPLFIFTAAMIYIYFERYYFKRRGERAAATAYFSIYAAAALPYCRAMLFKRYYTYYFRFHAKIYYILLYAIFSAPAGHLFHHAEEDIFW